MDTQLTSGAGWRAPDTVAAAPPSRSPWATWRVPCGLILLSVVPVAAGSARLVQLSGVTDTTSTARSVSFVVPLVLHIVSGIGFSLLGALQFSPALRRRGRAWHRVSGRLLVPVGLIAALSALWLTWLSAPTTAAGALLYGLRIAFGSAMVASLLVGVVAIRGGQVRRHRAWMTRAYAIGLGAGTQALTIGFGQAAFGRSALSHALLSGAGWVLNLAVAEWSISRRGPRPRRTTVRVAGSP